MWEKKRFPGRAVSHAVTLALLCLSVEDLQGELEKEEKGMNCDHHCECKAEHVGNLLPDRGCLSGFTNG